MSNLEAVLDRIEEKQKVEGQIQLSTSATSLDFLQAIYRDPTQPIQRRMRAAQAALPFEKPKLAVIARVREDDLADRLMAALTASGKVINGRAVRVIEPPQVETEQVEPQDHSKPFARLRRFEKEMPRYRLKEQYRGH